MADNLLERNFAPSVPNRAFASDITYIRTDEGRLYLVVVLDLFLQDWINAQQAKGVAA